MILVEPGAVGSNFWNNIKISTKSTNPNSPYRKLIDDVSEIFSEMSINPISPAEVGKVVSEAILSKKPQFRYIVGKDADFVLSNRNKMSEIEFEEFMKTQFKLSY